MPPEKAGETLGADQGTKPGPKMVPERDLIALKLAHAKELQALREESAQKDIKLSEQDSKIVELESAGGLGVADAKKKLLEDTKRHQDSIRAFDTRVKAFENEKHQMKATQLSTEYGVEVEELLNLSSEAEMEAYAYKAALAQLQESNKGSASTSQYEQGQASASPLDIPGMSDAQFKEHVAKQKTEAEKRATK